MKNSSYFLFAADKIRAICGNRLRIAGLSAALLVSSCGSEILPKPKGALRLEYPTATYASVADVPYCPFSFEANNLTELTHKSHSCDLNIEYPTMKATIYLTYKPVEGNLFKLLKDAQKFTYGHSIKADNIAANVFANDTTKVYGMFYQVYGNAASPAQFYATDSLHHFVSGSIYFRSVPNYDSIQPASDYVEKDVRRIMETLRWK
jgi:gliding motility-associated lipoprotein gldD